VLILLLLLAACEPADPYAAWPAEAETFPWAYTAETDLERWEEVRWETEAWDPQDDLAMAGNYLLKVQNHRPSAPIESLENFEQQRDAVPLLGGGTTLSFVGDIMWLGENWDAFADPVADRIDGALRIGNLETPTSADHPTRQQDLGLYEFNAPPEMLDGLPFDLLQLNNNHSMDVGEQGLENTLVEAADRGFEVTGVDRGATLDVDGRRVAFLSYTWGLNGKEPPADRDLFVIPFGHIEEDIDLTGLEAAAADARSDADAVVVLVHWGFEYEYYADPHFLQLGRRIVAAGADVVVGSGPHTAQPVEICHVNTPEQVPGVGVCSVRSDDGQPRTAAILYSLGNFDTMQPTLPLQSGLIVTVSLDPDVTGLQWDPVVTTIREGLRTVVPLGEMAALTDEHAAEAARLDAHMGTAWKR
jgi:hypothetical protein